MNRARRLKTVHTNVQNVDHQCMHLAGLQCSVVGVRVLVVQTGCVGPVLTEVSSATLTISEDVNCFEGNLLWNFWYMFSFFNSYFLCVCTINIVFSRYLLRRIPHPLQSELKFSGPPPHPLLSELKFPAKADCFGRLLLYHSKHQVLSLLLQKMGCLSPRVNVLNKNFFFNKGLF